MASTLAAHAHRHRSAAPAGVDREDLGLALYKCQLNGPVDCVDPGMETRSASETLASPKSAR